MNTTCFLHSYLQEYFKNKKYSVVPFQKSFDTIENQPKTTVLYYGYFNIDNILLQNKFLNSLFSSNKNTPVFFTNVQDGQVVSNSNFIGWKVDFEIPIFFNILEIKNFMYLQGGNPPRITFDTNFDSNLIFYGQSYGVPFSYELGYLPASTGHFFNNKYFENGISLVNLFNEDYPVFIKDKITGQVFQFNDNGQHL